MPEIEEEDIWDLDDESENKPKPEPPSEPLTKEQIELYLHQKNHLEHQIATIQAQAEAMIAPLKSALAKAKWHYEGRLELMLREKHKADGTKKIVYWNGTALLTKCGGWPKVTDSEKAVKYALEQGRKDLVIPASIAVGEYKKYAKQKYQETKEVIPGTELEPVRQSFSISAGKAKEEKKGELSE
jgi:hypothetical protein